IFTAWSLMAMIRRWIWQPRKNCAPVYARNVCRTQNESFSARESGDRSPERHRFDSLHPVRLPLLPRRPELAGVLQDAPLATGERGQAHLRFGQPLSDAATLLPLLRRAVRN